MRKISFISLILFLSCISFFTSCRMDSDLVLVDIGKSNAIIVISRDASPNVILAAREFQHYIKKKTQADLRILDDSEMVQGNLILIGDSNPVRSLDIDPFGKNKDSYIIKTYDDVLVLIGKSDEGTLNAVYSFLENYLGIRWYWPGELGEIVPERSSIAIGNIDIIETPDFEWRNRGPEGALWGATSGPTEMHARELLLGVSEEHQKEVQRWEQRNKWGGLKIYGGHALGEIFPPEKYAKTHPEYYALIDGKRDVPGPDYDYKHEGQICTTNPDVIKTAVAWAVDFFNNNPDYDGVHLTLNDGRGFCECDNCQALDTGEFVTRPGIDLEEMKSKPAKYTVISDRVFTFMNEVCKEVQKVHSGKYIVSMAYSRYTNPPKNIDIHPYVMPQYCMWSAYKHSNTEIQLKHSEIASGWAEAAPQTAIYEYHINGSWPGMHRHVVSQIANSIRFLNSFGIKYYQTQSGDEFAINGLNYYVTAKLLWDTSQNEDDILNDFYSNAFGSAADAIKAFHTRLQSAWSIATADGIDVNCSSLKKTRLLELFTPELIEACNNDLKTARERADTDMIKDRIDFYQKGLRFTELTVNAVRAAKQIEKKGIDLFPLDAAIKLIKRADPGEIKPLLEQALDAWEERNRFVDHLKNDYVVAYFWVKYNDVQRNFNPTQNLKTMLASL